MLRSGEIVTKPGELRNAADDPIEAGRCDLQQRGGGANVTMGEENGRHAFIDVEGERLRARFPRKIRENHELFGAVRAHALHL
jgi:hypothetical protein